MFDFHLQQLLLARAHLEECGNEGGGPDGPVEVEVVLAVPPGHCPGGLVLVVLLVLGVLVVLPQPRLTQPSLHLLLLKTNCSPTAWVRP